MATLKAMFRLYDGYSAIADKVYRKTQEATTKILAASGATDKFNAKLAATGASANSASSGLAKYLSLAAAIAATVKGTSTTDDYINTAARLNLINDGLQTQAELQQKIFDAAYRSKGAYSDMASAISKMGLLAGDTFTNNDELISFTELLQKSFKVSGANTTEQSSAMLQLSQAMAAGKLQGDEFRSIMENAPMLAQAIADYTGKTKGELKQMSADGTITADIIKNALFSAADDINGKFAEMPMTFAGYWNRIKNGVLQAFGSVMTKINNLINTEEFQGFINSFINGMYAAANAASRVIDSVTAIYSFMSSNWPILEPIIMGVVGALIAYKIVALVTNGILAAQALATSVLAASKALEAGATFAATAAQYGLNAALLACPITWIIGAIILIIVLIYTIIGVINKFAGTSVSATGVIMGAFAVVGAVIWNIIAGVYNFVAGIFIEIYNLLADFANFFANFLNDPAGAIVTLFNQIFDFVLGIVQSAAKLIDTIFGTDLAGAVQGFRNDMLDEISLSTGEQKVVVDKLNASDYQLDHTSYGDAWNGGYSTGESLDDKFSSFMDMFSNTDDKGTDYDPTVVTGTGTNGTVKVDLSDEDIGYLRDLAERDYINKFSTATLAPNITISFGDVHETADADKIAKRVQNILQEEIAVSAEG